MLTAAPTSDAPQAIDLAAEQAQQTAGDLLTLFLGSDTLLLGSVAMGLIALLTVSRVTARRRHERSTLREISAQTQAVHQFLENLRDKPDGASQGMCQYNFATGVTDVSDTFCQIVTGDSQGFNDEAMAQKCLDRAGVDLVALARSHAEQTDPFEVSFMLATSGNEAREMLLQACNMRNAEGEVRRMIAVVREVDPQVVQSTGVTAGSD